MHQYHPVHVYIALPSQFPSNPKLNLPRKHNLLHFISLLLLSVSPSTAQGIATPPQSFTTVPSPLASEVGSTGSPIINS